MIYPVHNMVEFNKTTSFTCNSKGSTRWFFKSSQGQLVLTLYFDNKIWFTSVTGQYTGQYYCMGLYNSQSPHKFLAKAALQVYGKFHVQVIVYGGFYVIINILKSI